MPNSYLPDRLNAKQYHLPVRRLWHFRRKWDDLHDNLQHSSCT
jgi:hypothetical protein